MYLDGVKSSFQVVLTYAVLSKGQEYVLIPRTLTITS